MELAPGQAWKCSPQASPPPQGWLSTKEGALATKSPGAHLTLLLHALPLTDKSRAHPLSPDPVCARSLPS